MYSIFRELKSPTRTTVPYYSYLYTNWMRSNTACAAPQLRTSCTYLYNKVYAACAYNIPRFRLRLHPDIYQPHDACKMKNMSSRNATSWPSDERYVAAATNTLRIIFAAGSPNLRSGSLYSLISNYYVPIFMFRLSQLYGKFPAEPMFIRICIVLFFPSNIFFFFIHVYSYLRLHIN